MILPEQVDLEEAVLVMEIATSAVQEAVVIQEAVLGPKEVEVLEAAVVVPITLDPIKIIQQEFKKIMVWLSFKCSNMAITD